MTPENNQRDGGGGGAAESAMARLEDVQRVTEAGLSYLDLEDLLDELLERTKDILSCDTAAVLLVEDDGETLAARAAKGLEEEVERGFRLPIGSGFAGRIAASRLPVVIPDLQHEPPVQPVNPLFREKDVRSLLGVPLLVEGEVIGVLHVGSLTRREFSESDLELLQLVADRVALSIERSRLAVSERVAKTLQQTLLPPKLPELPGLLMAARYLPAERESALGGDWYDVLELGHRRLALSVGDVAGHGVEAATYMGELRSAIRAYAMEIDSPAELMQRMTHFTDLIGSRMATAIYATLNLDTFDLSLARAGHPYPLLQHADGSSTFLTGSAGPPLGTGLHTEYVEEQLRLESGQTLLLYTDGLIERRGESLREGEEALIEAMGDAPSGPQEKCREVMRRLTEGGTADDVAMLAIQAVGLGAALATEIPANPTELARARHLIRRWVAAQGGSDDDCAAFAIAVTEACANSVEHAYGLDDGTVEIGARLDEGVATVTVTDHGSWRAPRGENRGRGYLLMEEFMDDVAVEQGEDGTAVQLSRRLEAKR